MSYIRLIENVLQCSKRGSTWLLTSIHLCKSALHPMKVRRLTRSLEECLFCLERPEFDDLILGIKIELSVLECVVLLHFGIFCGIKSHSSNAVTIEIVTFFGQIPNVRAKLVPASYFFFREWHFLICNKRKDQNVVTFRANNRWFSTHCRLWRFVWCTVMMQAWSSLR